MTYRLLLIEDQSLVRTSLSALLNSSTPFQVTHSVATVKEAIDLLIAEHEFDLILCDYNLHNDTAKTLLKHNQNRLAPPVVLLTSLFNAIEIQSCLALGARGFLFKESSLEDFIRAITLVINGGSYFSSPQETAAPSNQPKIRSNQLTPTEKEILHWLATGMSNKQIALAIGKSSETIKAHTSSILKKLSCKTRTQAVTKAAQLNWL